MTSRIAIIFIAISFAIVETIHFGGNAFPKTDAEVICDGIACVIFCLAFLPQKKE